MINYVPVGGKKIGKNMVTNPPKCGRYQLTPAGDCDNVYNTADDNRQLGP